MGRPKKPSKVIVCNRRRIFSDFLSVDEAELSYETYAGGMCGPVRRLSLERGDSAGLILLETGEGGGQVILVEQFRFPTLTSEGGWLQEAIAGMIEKGEDAESTLRREALEEVGYTVGELEHIATYFPSPGTSSERIFVYFAAVGPEDRVDGRGGGLAVENEDIRIIRTPIKIFLENIKSAIYKDSKIYAAGFWLNDRFSKVLD